MDQTTKLHAKYQRSTDHICIDCLEWVKISVIKIFFDHVNALQMWWAEARCYMDFNTCCV